MNHKGENKKKVVCFTDEFIYQIFSGKELMTLTIISHKLIN